jgi:hypothetical protein
VGEVFGRLTLMQPSGQAKVASETSRTFINNSLSYCRGITYENPETKIKGIHGLRWKKELLMRNAFPSFCPYLGGVLHRSRTLVPQQYIRGPILAFRYFPGNW